MGSTEENQDACYRLPNPQFHIRFTFFQVPSHEIPLRLVPISLYVSVCGRLDTPYMIVWYCHSIQ